MILSKNIGSVYSRGNEIQRVFSYGKLVWEKEEPEIDYSVMPFTVKAVDDNFYVNLTPKKPNNKPTPVLDFKYSLNGGEWIEGKTNLGINLRKNDILKIIATDIEHCSIRGLSDIYGNILSLIHGDNFAEQTIFPERGERYDTDGFFNNGEIRNAENLILPAMILSEKAYENMFRGCTSLITAPKKLPATELSYHCYDSMFYGCSSLTTAPELPATNLSYRCYYEMFRGCSNLTNIKCYATNSGVFSFDDCIHDWTELISTNGKLVCKRVDGGKNPIEDYIPDTWTVEYMN